METSVSHILEFTVNHCWFSHRQVVSYFALVICTVILTRVYGQPGPHSEDQLIVATRPHTLGGCFTRTLAPPAGSASLGQKCLLCLFYRLLQNPPFSGTRKKSGPLSPNSSAFCVIISQTFFPPSRPWAGQAFLEGGCPFWVPHWKWRRTIGRVWRRARD